MNAMRHIISKITAYLSKKTDCIKSVEKPNAAAYNEGERRAKELKVEIKINADCQEPFAVIHTAEITDEVNTAVKKLSDNSSDIITGFSEDNAEILNPSDIYRIYAENQKVLAVTDEGVFQIRMRLYQLEEKLAGMKFARISNSEIINLQKTEKFDLSIAGTIHVKMKNGQSTYVSRRYVAKIKEILGI